MLCLMDRLEQQIIDSYSWACHYAACCTANFSNSFDREELKSAGILGYVAAACRYDERKGILLSVVIAPHAFEAQSWMSFAARPGNQGPFAAIIGCSYKRHLSWKRNCSETRHTWNWPKPLGIGVGDLIQLAEALAAGTLRVVG